ncbi:hypothetical protein M8C21_007189 [Ambrosia artemisiifolia]|uniref:AIR9-like A9 domain-containing protein n=1 Tax=Ambrosia artemisiifolia TaxID=4212 RepID=A0AAD5G6A3_AMBAR|nr:hypothetical protein M8C21_007189 [Ambrosia artemisiifolia]
MNNRYKLSHFIEENHRLRSELQKKSQELEDYKSSEKEAESSHPAGHWNDHGYLPPTKSPIEGRIKMGSDFALYDSSTVVHNKDFRETQKVTEAVTMVPSGRTTANNGGMFSSASTSSLSPSRYQLEREYDPQFNVTGHGLGPISKVSNAYIPSNPSNQAVIDTRDQEQEILLLRKHVADYSIKAIPWILEVLCPNYKVGNEGEPFANWNSHNTPYTATLEDPNSYSPYLTPVLEEPGSSFSEAADDDPLPTVESLQISGEAFPGRELLASGYSRNGTTSCNFEWVRHMEDGSVNYIEGAKQPTYVVTADDVDTYLAIEVQPMDDRKRKGELVKLFANENRKIVCDPDMHDHIRKALQTGHAEYKLSLWVFIPYESRMEFFIYGLGSVEIRLRVEQDSAAIRW